MEPIDPDDLAHERQHESLDEEESLSVPQDRPIDSPEADALEQRTEVGGDDEFLDS
jgi:hypothetical protein